MAKLILGTNDLATVNPELATEWHPTKNGELGPDNVTVGSAKKVWWLGKCGHEWEATIKNRNRKESGCPLCRYKKAKETRQKNQAQKNKHSNE